MSNRADSFHIGQVWESPRLVLYKVMDIKNNQAILRLGPDGDGRLIRRDWDAVINWRLHSDENLS